MQGANCHSGSPRDGPAFSLVLGGRVDRSAAAAHSVLWLLDAHRLRLSNWIAMNLLPQTLLGAAAAELFGFSFTGLRAVTLAMLTSLVAFSFYRTSGLSRPALLVATIILVVTPGASRSPGPGCHGRPAWLLRGDERRDGA